MSPVSKVKKVVRRETAFILDSSILGGAINKTADGSGFSVQLDPPLIIPPNAINATIDVEESAIWNTTPNIFDSGPKQNNLFQFFYSRPRIQLNLEIPKGAYEVFQIEQEINRAIIEGSNGDITSNAIQLIPNRATGRIGVKVLYSNIYKILSNNNTIVIDYGTGTQAIVLASGNYTLEELVNLINLSIILVENNPVTTNFITLKNKGVDGEDQSQLELEVIWNDTINFGKVLFPIQDGMGPTLGFTNNNFTYYDYGNVYTGGIVNGNIFFPLLNSIAPVLGFPVQTGVLYSQLIEGSLVPKINSFNYYLIQCDLVDRGIRFNNDYNQIIDAILVDVATGEQILTRPIYPATCSVEKITGNPVSNIRVQLLTDALEPADTGSNDFYIRVSIKWFEPIEIHF